MMQRLTGNHGAELGQVLLLGLEFSLGPKMGHRLVFCPTIMHEKSQFIKIVTSKEKSERAIRCFNLFFTVTL